MKKSTQNCFKKTQKYFKNITANVDLKKNKQINVYLKHLGLLIAYAKFSLNVVNSLSIKLFQHYEGTKKF